MKRIVLGLSLFLLALAVIFQSSVKTFAATSSPDGISLSPAFQQVNIGSNEAKTTAKFIISNNTDQPTVLNLSVNDFNTLDESGGLFFVGTNPTQLQQRYGLAKWASLPVSQVTILPHQNTTVNVDILNQSTLMPGGHYGALMVAISSGGSSNNGNNVNVKPVASSLMFVTKLGGDTHKLELLSVSAKHGPFRVPTNVDLNFRNTGNTHLTPRGVVSVFDPGGKLISKGIINENSNLILPETKRLFTVNLNSLGTALWPGRYKVRAEVRFDGLDQARVYQSSFFIIPAFTWFIIILLAALLLVVWLKIKKNKQSRKQKTKD